SLHLLWYHDVGFLERLEVQVALDSQTHTLYSCMRIGTDRLTNSDGLLFRRDNDVVEQLFSWVYHSQRKKDHFSADGHSTNVWST
ncbi:hypothetical protein Bhyg_15943, partial [Pseudolycoriella hygida]